MEIPERPCLLLVDISFFLDFGIYNQYYGYYLCILVHIAYIIFRICTLEWNEGI
jgi:hypothetical protein